MAGGNGEGQRRGVKLKLKQGVEMTQMNPLAQQRDSPFQSQQPQQTREQKRQQELALAQRKKSIRRLSKLKQQQQEQREQQQRQQQSSPSPRSSRIRRISELKAKQEALQQAVTVVVELCKSVNVVKKTNIY